MMSCLPAVYRTFSESGPHATEYTGVPVEKGGEWKAHIFMALKHTVMLRGLKSWYDDGTGLQSKY